MELLIFLMMGRPDRLLCVRFSMLMTMLYLILAWILFPRSVKCDECTTSELHVHGAYYYEFYHVAGVIGASFLNFSDTRANCQRFGGDMPVIISVDQNNFIAERLQRVDGGHYYIGLEDLDNDGVYRWIDGTTNMTNGYNNWQDDKVLYKYVRPHCAVMRTAQLRFSAIHGSWNRVSCSSPRRQICQIPVDVHCKWQTHRDSQYLVVSEIARFNDARSRCQGFGGDLALIKTHQVNIFLQNLTKQSTWCYYFGLRNITGKFAWLDDTKLRYNDSLRSWSRGVNGNVTCLYQGQWYMSNDWQRRYICERTRGFDNTISYGGVDYFISPSWMTRNFSNARTYCQFHGGDLAVIKSNVTSAFLHGRITELRNNVSLELTRRSNEGSFTWIDGTPLQYFSFGSPGRNTRGNCAALQHSDSNMRRISTPCSDKQHFICERYQEYNWSELDGSLYYISQSLKTSHSFAQKFCQEQGANLAQPKTGKINNFLINLANGNSFWLGLEITTSGRKFKWIDGTLISRKHFMRNYTWSNYNETLFESERCIHQQVRNGWRKLPCTSYLRFACEKPSHRFEVRSEKTNPGVAKFSCTYTTSWRPDPVPEYVKAAQMLNEGHLINHTSSNSSGNSVTSYFYDYIEREEPIYCFVGNPEESSGFASIRVPTGDFFALPNYTGTPEIIEPGYNHAVVRWRQWNPEIDTGDGPIVGYKIYVRSDSEDVFDEKVLPPGVANSSESVSERFLQNATDMVTYNVTELEAGSTYAIQIAAIRDGIKGEGEQGPPLNFTTKSLPVTSTVSSTSQDLTTKTIAADGHDESLDDKNYEHVGPGGQTSSSTATVAGGVVGIIIVILIVIIVIILFKQRRKVNLSKPVNEEQETSVDFEDTALDASCSGQETISTQNKPTPRNIGTKPAIATKPCRRELTDATHRAQEPADDQSGTKPLKRQPIPTSQFPAFVSTNRYTSLFSDEFHDLPEADIYPQTVAQKEINHRKNRYKNILPYDSARVKLRVINDDPNSDYFNASYIPSFENDKAYIASQGPNNASVDDFWRMVWQEKVTNIAMVTKLKEGDKIKCAQYWPNKPGDSKMFGNVKVEFVSQNPCTGGVKREMTMKMGKDKRTVTQFHFQVWPDKGVPKHTSLLLKFIKEVKANHGQNPHPLVIHCSAGVGRTGVVISIDSIAEHAKRTRMVDVFSFVTKIRQNRPFMVQTQEQYAFIYGAVLEDLLWRNTYVPIIHFSDHLKDLRSVDEGGKSKMTKEFETLMTLCPDPPASQTRSGRTPENHHKNRYGNNLPLQRNRVILDSPDNDYINASCIRGVHCTFITTQMPMPSTVSDFCCMVLTRQPSFIVMLNDKDQDDKSCAQYWSDDGIAELGSYRVSILSTSEDDDMTIRQLKITKNSKSCHTVTQYQFLGWQKHGSNEKSRALSFHKLIGAVKSALKNKSEFSVLVHCLSGVGRTGVFCSVMECIAHMEDSDSVDIFQTVKILRADRMQFVQTEEDYAFIYDVIRAYLHEKNYEQLPYPVEDHTYGNLDTDDYCTPDPEENPYEVTDSQAAGASGLMYGNVETERAKQSQRPTPTNSQTLYENFEFES